MISNTYFTSNISLKNTTTLPNNIHYFFEGDFTELIELDNSKIHIDTLTSVVPFIDIVDYKLYKYTKSNSYSGLSLPNNKLIVELNFSRHIKYVSENKISSSMINLDDITRIVSIAIPDKIYDIPINDIIRRGDFNITPYIENIFFKKITNRSFLISISTLINVKF